MILLTPRDTSDLCPGEDEVGVDKVTTRRASGSPPRTTVDDQVVGRDVVPCVAEEEDRGVCDLFDKPPSSQRDALARLRAAGLVLPGQSVHALCAGDGAGGDDVACDPQRAVLDGHVGREGVDAGLRDGDVRLHREPGVVDRRGDVDDAAARCAGGGVWEGG